MMTTASSPQIQPKQDSPIASRYHQAALDLLSEWQQQKLLLWPRDETTTTRNERKEDNHVIVIDAWQLYRLGQVLVQLKNDCHGGGRLEPSHQRRKSTVVVNSLVEASHDVLAALPAADRRSAFRNLHIGLLQLLVVDERDEPSIDEAILVLSELYSLAGDGAPTAAEFQQDGASVKGTDPSLGWDDDIQGDRTLHRMLLYLYGTENAVEASARSRDDAAMKIVTRLVWTDRPTFVHDGSAVDDDDAVQTSSDGVMFSVLRTLQALEMAWTDFVRYHDDRDENWRPALMQHYQHQEDLDSDQLAYLASLLHAPTLATTSNDSATRWSSGLNLRPAAAAAGAATGAERAGDRNVRESELDRRIRQVRQILPDLGEGFVEAALSYYQGDVERTVTALLQEMESGGENDSDGNFAGTLPEALRGMDWSLPRRTKGRRRSDSFRADGADDEAIRITKSIIREADQRQEEEAYALQRVGVDEDSPHDQFRDEYDDDYDDQYDDYQPRVDEKADSDDYEAIRLYNRALKSVEREQVFWEEERNTNRASVGRADRGTHEDVDGDSAPKYRGPDKLRGGRIPRDQRPGGRGTRGHEQPSRNAAGRAPSSSTAGNSSDGRGGRGRGRGRGRGGGRGDSGGARGPTADQATGRTDSGAPPPQGTSTTSSRAKDNRLSNRRDKQKQAAAKRAG